MVRSTYLFLPSFEDIPIVQEERLHLVNTTRRNENKIEDGKEPELHGECAISHFPEGEATEEGCEDMKHDLIPHVVLPRSVDTLDTRFILDDIPEIARSGLRDAWSPS